MKAVLRRKKDRRNEFYDIAEYVYKHVLEQDEVYPDGTVFTISLRGNMYYVTMIPEKSDRRVYCVITDMFGFTITTETATLRMKDDLNQAI